MVKTTQPVIINIQRRLQRFGSMVLRRSSMALLASGIVGEHLATERRVGAGAAAAAKGRDSYERTRRRRQFRSALIERIRTETNNQQLQEGEDGEKQREAEEDGFSPVGGKKKGKKSKRNLKGNGANNLPQTPGNDNDNNNGPRRDENFQPIQRYDLYGYPIPFTPEEIEEAGVSDVALQIAGFVKISDRKRYVPKAHNPLLAPKPGGATAALLLLGGGEGGGSAANIDPNHHANIEGALSRKKTVGGGTLKERRQQQAEENKRRKKAEAAAAKAKKLVLPNNEVEQCFLVLTGGALVEDVAEHRFAYGKELQIAVAKDADIRINRIVQKTFNMWLMLAGFLGFVALGFSFMGLLEKTEAVVEEPVHAANGVWGGIGTSVPNMPSTLNAELVGYGSWANFTESCCCVPYAIPIHSQEGGGTNSLAALMAYAGGTANAANATSAANSREARPSGADGAKEHYSNAIAKVEKWVCANGRVKERVRAARSGDYSAHPNKDSFAISSESLTNGLAAATQYRIHDSTSTVRPLCGVQFYEPTCEIVSDYTGKVMLDGCGTVTDEYRYLW